MDRTRAEHHSDKSVTRRADLVLSGEASVPVYTTQDHAGGIYVRNPLNWCADIDLTCISPWNSVGTHQRAGVLITPRHIVLAQHYPLADGTTIRFVADDNTVVTRTVTNSLQIATTDMRVSILDSDVPESISFAKCLPSDYLTYLRCAVAPNNIVPGLPVISTDQEEKLLYMELRRVIHNNGGVYYTQMHYAADLIYPEYASLHEQYVTGDSGSACFLIINNEPIILSCVYGSEGVGGRFVGPAIHYYAAQVNTALTTLGGGYQLTTIDLDDAWNPAFNIVTSRDAPLVMTGLEAHDRYLVMHGLTIPNPEIIPERLFDVENRDLSQSRTWTPSRP